MLMKKGRKPIRDEPTLLRWFWLGDSQYSEVQFLLLAEVSKCMRGRFF
jgi:hypothetical protein